jgi:hypothetical protein
MAQITEGRIEMAVTPVVNDTRKASRERRDDAHDLRSSPRPYLVHAKIPEAAKLEIWNMALDVDFAQSLSREEVSGPSADLGGESPSHNRPCHALSMRR